MRLNLFISIAIILAAESHGQELQFIKAAKINSPHLISSDKRGNIYVADIKGNLYQFDSDLNLSTNVYSPEVPSPITSLDSRQGMKTFVFYESMQEFTLLNRFLGSPASYRLQGENINFIVAATPAFDNKLWLLDQPTRTLIKYDYLNKQIDFTKPLDLIITDPVQSPLLFTEYKSRIYLADRSGVIYIFDNLGNFLLKKQISGLSWAGFYKNDFYFFSKRKLAMADIYSLETQKEYNLNLRQAPRAAVVADKKLFVLEDEKVSLFSIP